MSASLQPIAPEAQAASVAMALGSPVLFSLRDFVAHAIMSAQGVQDALMSGDVATAKLLGESHDARLRILLAACDYELRRREEKP